MEADAKERASREAVRERLSGDSGDFASVLVDRQIRYIENRKRFRDADAQTQRLDYINDILESASADFQEGRLNLMGFAAMVGPTLVMMHNTGGIRNTLSEAWHVRMADQAKIWAEADPARFGKFYETCRVYQRGERLPYDAHTAALDGLALEHQRWKDIRRDGVTDEEKAAIEKRYEDDKADLKAMCARDGVPEADIEAQRRQIVANLAIRDPKFAAEFGLCPGTEEYGKAADATEAKFGPEGEAAPPETMHAANKDPGWGDEYKPGAKEPIDQAAYEEEITNGRGSFTHRESVILMDEATGGEPRAAGRTARAKQAYWMTRMAADGISEDSAARTVAKGISEKFRRVSEAVKAASAAFREKMAEGKEPVAGSPFERLSKGLRSLEASLREDFRKDGLDFDTMYGKTTGRAAENGKAPDKSAGMPENGLGSVPDALRRALAKDGMVRIGKDAVDLSTGKTVSGVNLSSGFDGAHRDWAKEGGFGEYLSAVESRMGPKERFGALMGQARRAFSRSEEGITVKDFIRGLREDRDLLIRDGVMRDLRDKGAKGLPETLLSGDGRRAMARGECDDGNRSAVSVKQGFKRDPEKAPEKAAPGPLGGNAKDGVEAGATERTAAGGEGVGKVLVFPDAKKDNQGAAARVLAAAEQMEERDASAKRDYGLG